MLVGHRDHPAPPAFADADHRRSHAVEQDAGRGPPRHQRRLDQVPRTGLVAGQQAGLELGVDGGRGRWAWTGGAGLVGPAAGADQVQVGHGHPPRPADPGGRQPTGADVAVGGHVVHTQGVGGLLQRHRLVCHACSPEMWAPVGAEVSTKRSPFKGDEAAQRGHPDGRAEPAFSRRQVENVGRARTGGSANLDPGRHRPDLVHRRVSTPPGPSRPAQRFDATAVRTHNGAVSNGGRPTRDLTVIAVPFYFGAMAAEYRRLRRRAAASGPTAGDYERRDTRASLTMGTLSLLAPLVVPRLLRPVHPGPGPLRQGRWWRRGGRGGRRHHGRRRRGAAGRPPTPHRTPGGRGVTERVGDGPTQVAADPRSAAAARVAVSRAGWPRWPSAGVAVTTAWASRTSPERLWRRRLLPDLGRGPLALAAGRRRLGLHLLLEPPLHAREPLHVGHPRGAPLERALQPVHRAAPAGGRRPRHLPPLRRALPVRDPARRWSRRRGASTSSTSSGSTPRPSAGSGPPEAVLNTPSHHRVHHGSNRQYLDRNHGSILIVWDRLFGTFEPEGEPVVYGLTKNINTFDPARIAGHEYAEMLRDVAASTSWRERLSYVVRGPGWATRHRAEVAAAMAERPPGLSRPGAGCCGRCGRRARRTPSSAAW